MRTKLSLKEALERRGDTAAESPVSSAFPKHSVLLMRVGDIDRPIDFVHLLMDGGVSLKKARMVLDRLAIGEPTAVELNEAYVEQLVAALGRLGVRAIKLVNRSIDPKNIREKQGLSQPEFADLYGLDVDTLKNWEQGRNVPDGPARVLLRVIEHRPDAVIEARTFEDVRIRTPGLRVKEGHVETIGNSWDWFEEWKSREYRITYQLGDRGKKIAK
jgi:transcriptional regulator with XRE-family HTH domain